MKTAKMKTDTKPSKWERIGEVGVDAGMLMICDPLAVEEEWRLAAETAEIPIGANAPKPIEVGDLSLAGCRLTAQGNARGGQLHYGNGSPGAGIVIRAGYGDGVEDVYIRRSVTGHIVELRVIMDGLQTDLAYCEE